jgi:large subunit ribosomal protein L30
MAKVIITQVKSRIGSTKIQKRNLDALGLRKMGRTVQHDDSPVIMGMIERVRHLVKVEIAPAETKKTVKAEPKAEAPKAEAAEVEAKAEKPAKPAAKKPAAPKAPKAEE